MRSSRFFVALFIALLFVAAMPLGAQNLPMPTKEGEPFNTYDGKKLYPYSSPYADHAGRFIDSFQTTTYYATPRTLRAKGLSVVPDQNRIYAMIGEHFVMYNLSSFFNDLGSPLSSAIVNKNTRKTPPEQYLPWARHTYPEDKGSGWNWYVADGLDRLYDYSWDDRGYTYAAYSLWGWGVLDSNLTLVKQIEQVSDEPRVINSFKVGNKYYVLASGKSFADIWDVTQPTNPIKVRTLEFGASVAVTAKAGTEDMIGLVGKGSSGTETRIYRGSDLIVGGNPVIARDQGGYHVGLDTDGTNFYITAFNDAQRQSVIDIYTLSNASGPSYSLDTTTLSGKKVSGVRYGSGHLTLWGIRYTDAAPDIWLYRLENGVPAERDLGDFYSNYYGSRADTGYVRLNSYGNYVFVSSAPFGEALYTTYGGKEYLIISAMGLGDVFELESPDRLNIALDGVVGDPNPHAPSTSTGTFYGDPLRFSATYPAGQVNVNWNFGNPQGIASQNQQTLPSTQRVTYQYAGLTTTNAITQSKSVTASDATNSANNASVSVSMKVPTARVRLLGTSAILPGGDLAEIGVVAGDKFVDASDGTLQSHFGEWNVDGTVTKAATGFGVPVGTCGPRTLNYTARYVPYNGTGTNITPLLDNPLHFTQTVGPISYEVKPFIPKIEFVETTGGIEFRNKTRYTASTFNAGSHWTVVWRLRNAAGEIMKTEQDATTIGTLDKFVLQQAEYQAGYTLEMTVTLTAASLADTSCVTDAYLTASATYELEKPDPTILKTGCTVAKDECTLSIASISGADTSAWTVKWYLNGNLSGSGPTFEPNITEQGSYIVSVNASNQFGSGDDSESLTVAAPACESPGAFSMTWKGVTSGCSGASCVSANESLKFTAAPWQWHMDSCHEFLWEFGDGATSTDQSPTHKYSKNGTYTLKLKISAGGESSTETIILRLPGTTTPPPPPPTCSTPRGASPSYAGVTSGCSPTNPNCEQGETIRFTGDAWGYNIQSCDSFRWTFGDGSTSTSRNPSHVYSSPGTYTATFRIQNSGGSSTGEITLTVKSSDECPKVPVLSGIYYSAPAGGSGCNATNSTGCLPNEAIQFKPETWQYNWQDCDVFAWDFGDGTTSSLREPKHTFTEGAERIVTLTVTNTKGSSDTVTKTILIGTPATPPSQVSFNYSPSSPKPGEAVTFTATQNGGDPATSWTWNFGDGKTATGKVVTHTFVSEGQFSVSLVARNSGGDASNLPVKTVRVSDSLTYLLPVATHAGGLEGTEWRTDLHVFQPEFADGGTEVEFEYRVAGNSPKTETRFFDKSTENIEDFVNILFGEGASSGLVLVRSRVPLEMWTRTYVVSASGVGTYGQLIPAVLYDQAGIPVGNSPVWSIVGLQHSTKVRTNLGFTNPTSQAANITVDLLSSDGSPSHGGSFTVDVPAYQWIQKPLAQFYAGLELGDQFSLRITSNTGVEVFSYASVIDNISNDPVFVGALPDAVASDSSMQQVVVPGVGHFGSWKSDLAIFNPGSNPVEVSFDYYDTSGQNLASVMGVLLHAKTTLMVEDFLPTGMDVDAETIGALHIRTTSESDLYPIVFARTYSDQEALGTFGQGISAIPLSEGNVRNGAPAFLTGIQNDHAYYTNLGLVSLSDQPTQVRIVELNPNTGHPGNARVQSLAPYQSLIINKVLPGFLNSELSTATIMIEVLSGGPVWAYGSVIDDLTKDPEYVPAVPASPSASALNAVVE